MISTRDLSGLPDIDTLKRLMQSMAMLDAILSPEWEYRYYSFNAKWSSGEQMGSMRDGCGDDLHAIFTDRGCFLKGFAHEAEMTLYKRKPKSVWPGVFNSVPWAFQSGLNQPAFSPVDTTFCIWREYGDAEWQRGKIKFPKVKSRFDGTPGDPDGSSGLLSPYDGKPETYLSWASDYFLEGDGNDRSLTLEHVRHVYDHKPLTSAREGDQSRGHAQVALERHRRDRLPAAWEQEVARRLCRSCGLSPAARRPRAAHRRIIFCRRTTAPITPTS